MKQELEAKCRCCGCSEIQYLWHGTLIGFNVAYFECQRCMYIQTERPYWLEKAYSDVINNSDTGILTRNFVNARKVVVTLGLLGATNGRVVDFSAGYGLLEHFTDPGAELDRMLEIGGNVLLSTDIIADPAPAQNEWWYYGREHGQHIGFYREITLKNLAQERGLHFISNGLNYHLITKEPVSQTLWLGLMRLSRYISPIITKFLESKTWSDHMELSNKDCHSK
jgi:hypothetical protein